MNVTLLAHTQLAQALIPALPRELVQRLAIEKVKSGQVVSLAAIRQCYSHKTAMEVLETESEKYFGSNGKEGARLMNHIVKSGHTSTLEHIHFAFAVEGVSRALLAQLTRHRQLSFSVQSQRYNKFSSGSRSGGFGYVVPESVTNSERKYTEDDMYADDYGASYPLSDLFDYYMHDIQVMYDKLIELGVPQEDARAVLPNAAACNLVTSGNLRAWLEFYNKRKKGNGAQKEVSDLAELIRNEITTVEPWTKDYFEMES